VYVAHNFSTLPETGGLPYDVKVQILCRFCVVSFVSILDIYLLYTGRGWDEQPSHSGIRTSASTGPRVMVDFLRSGKE